MTSETIIRTILENLGFALLILAVAVATALWFVAGRRGFAAKLFRWTSLLAVGVTGIYTFVGHVFFPNTSAEEIGWQPSPFQYEVGMADLTVGVLGVLAFWGNFGFRLATTIAATLWFGGDAIGHVRQMIVADNFAPGNAGSWFWLDVLLPLVMVGSLAASQCCRASEPSSNQWRA